MITWKPSLVWTRTVMANEADRFAICLNKFFITHLPNVKGVSPQTIDAYRYTFIRFLEYMLESRHKAVDKVRISDLSYGNVCGYLDWLETSRHTMERPPGNQRRPR